MVQNGIFIFVASQNGQRKVKIRTIDLNCAQLHYPSKLFPQHFLHNLPDIRGQREHCIHLTHWLYRPLINTCYGTIICNPPCNPQMYVLTTYQAVLRGHTCS